MYGYQSKEWTACMTSRGSTGLRGLFYFCHSQRNNQIEEAESVKCISMGCGVDRERGMDIRIKFIGRAGGKSKKNLDKTIVERQGLMKCMT